MTSGNFDKFTGGVRIIRLYVITFTPLRLHFLHILVPISFNLWRHVSILLQAHCNIFLFQSPGTKCHVSHGAETKCHVSHGAETKCHVPHGAGTKCHVSHDAEQNVTCPMVLEQNVTCPMVLNKMSRVP